MERNLLQFLTAVQRTLNELPNKSLKHVEGYKDTYELASRVGDLIKEVNEEEFPNGFRSWMETHHEIVDYIRSHIEEVPVDHPLSFNIGDIYKKEGYAGMYDVAYKWANEFELINKGKKWDGEFVEEVLAFCDKKNKEGKI